ncbi:MAG: hypothetical protein GY828_01980, partial [Candidatus Gracilibacteria bacterium]|nr:hypothetical protein [Candidatus Gracilibacteria bacterium]
ESKDAFYNIMIDPENIRLLEQEEDHENHSIQAISEINIEEMDITEMTKIIHITPELLQQEQQKDKILLQVYQWIKNKEIPKNVRMIPSPVLRKFALNLNNFQIHEQTDILCRREFSKDNPGGVDGIDKICLPLSLVIPVFYQAHAGVLQGHYGITKTLATMKNTYYFPGLFKWCITMIADCLPCQKNKAVRKDLNTA